MGASQRLKGQDCVLSIQVDGSLQTRIDSIQSAEIELELELLQDGFLGETFDRLDTVYKAIRVKLDGHVNSQAYLELFDAIAGKAQRRAGSPVRIDLMGTFMFPNGDFPSLLIPDVQFESIPMTLGGRDEHVSFELNGKASGYKLVT